MAIHTTLTIKVAYDIATIIEEGDILKQLTYAGKHLAEKGLLSGDDMVIEEWSQDVAIQSR